MKAYTLKKPLARSLYENIREEIVTRSIKPGTRLPSKREIASRFSLSLITVEHALDQLESEGFIEARERSGTYVLPQPSYRSSKEDPFEIRLLAEEPLSASEIAAKRLRQTAQRDRRISVQSPRHAGAA